MRMGRSFRSGHALLGTPVRRRLYLCWFFHQDMISPDQQWISAGSPGSPQIVWAGKNKVHNADINI
jgi:hypothetical protein